MSRRRYHCEEQATLFDLGTPLAFEPEPEEPEEIIPTGAPVEIRPRVTGQALKILRLLRTGPATNTQFAEIAMQYNARIFDLRRAGFDIEIIDRNDDTGVNVYALTAEPLNADEIE